MVERTFHMLLYRAFHAQRNYLRSYLGEVGLEVGQPKLLGYLFFHGPCRQSQLAGYFDIDSAAVSRMLDSLERSGLILRKADENNRRCNQVQLTDRGRQAYEVWLERCRETEEVMLQGFTPQEQAQFADFLSRAYQNFRKEREKEG